MSDKLKELVAHAEYLATQLRTATDPDVKTASSKMLSKALEQIEDIRSDVKLADKVSALGHALSGNIGGTTELGTGEPVPADAVAAFIGSPEFKSIAQDKSRRGDTWEVAPELRFKTPVDPADANPADLVQNVVPGIVTPFRFPLKVGSLFSQATMSGSSVTALKATAEDGKAGLTDIGAQKAGPATMALDVENPTYARKVTATMTLPEESLDDLPGLEQEIRRMLLTDPNGIAEKLEDQYLNGSGSGTPAELVGVLGLSPDETDISPSERLSKRIFKAACEIEDETGFPAAALVINPLDAFPLFTEEDDVKRPLWGPYGASYSVDGANGAPNSLSVVRSRKLSQGTILVGAFKASIRYVRKAVSIRASSEGIGLADKNLVLFVAECREALRHVYGKAPYRTVTIES